MNQTRQLFLPMELGFRDTAKKPRAIGRKHKKSRQLLLFEAYDQAALPLACPS
ncbi:MAG: hypothetical protein VYA30_14000 [Myxococcota bacterium]|nr:hypothetical protein [Myxococcota bacterium]